MPAATEEQKQAIVDAWFSYLDAIADYLPRQHGNVSGQHAYDHIRLTQNQYGLWHLAEQIGYPRLYLEGVWDPERERRLDELAKDPELADRLSVPNNALYQLHIRQMNADQSVKIETLFAKDADRTYASRRFSLLQPVKEGELLSYATVGSVGPETLQLHEVEQLLNGFASAQDNAHLQRDAHSGEIVDLSV